MAQERLAPDTELVDSGLSSSTVTDHDADPDSDSTTTAATGNNTNTDYRVGFANPVDALTAGSGLQEFKAGVEEFDSGQTGTPTARIELWEGGNLVRAGSNTNISTYQVLSFTWDASEITDDTAVECRVVGTKSGGSPSKRNTVNIGQIEWNAEVSA